MALSKSKTYKNYLTHKFENIDEIPNSHMKLDLKQREKYVKRQNYLLKMKLNYEKKKKAELGIANKNSNLKNQKQIQLCTTENSDKKIYPSDEDRISCTDFEASVALAEREEEFYKKRVRAFPNRRMHTASEYEETIEVQEKNIHDELLIEREVQNKLSMRKAKKTKLDTELCSDDSITDDELISKRIYSSKARELKFNFSEKEKKYKLNISKLEDSKTEMMTEIQNLRTENAELREIIEIKTQEISELSQKVEKYGEFNFELQNKILPHITNFVMTQSDEMNKATEAREKVNEKHMDLGHGVRISSSAWYRLKAHSNYSLLVKEFASLIWGEDELRKRSVTGRKCPTKETLAKPPLTPHKVSIIHDKLRGILVEKGCSDDLVLRELKLVNKYLREKISDSTRKHIKKNLLNSFERGEKD